MSTQPFRLGFERKIGYSFVGLLAGNLVTVAAFTLCLALNLIPARAQWLTSPSLHSRLSMAMVCAVCFGIISLIVWVVIGLPVVLSLSAGFIVRLHWLLASLVGAVFGVVSLELFFMVVEGWRRTLDRLKDPGRAPSDTTFLAIAAVIACVAWSIYCALVRRASRYEQRKSGAPSRTPQFFSIF